MTFLEDTSPLLISGAKPVADVLSELAAQMNAALAKE